MDHETTRITCSRRRQAFLSPPLRPGFLKRPVIRRQNILTEKTAPRSPANKNCRKYEPEDGSIYAWASSLKKSTKIGVRHAMNNALVRVERIVSERIITQWCPFYIALRRVRDFVQSILFFYPPRALRVNLPFSSGMTNTPSLRISRPSNHISPPP